MALSKKDEMTKLGLLALIPFWASAIALWLSPWILPLFIALDFHQVALIYGGAVAAYIAGVGDGRLFDPKVNAGSFIPGQLAVLIAIAAMLPSGTFFFSIGAAWRHAIILALLVYLLMRDLSTVRDGLAPPWYGTLRIRLTFWAGIAIVLIISRLILLGYY